MIDGANIYSYCRNNAVRFVDHKGMKGEDPLPAKKQIHPTKEKFKLLDFQYRGDAASGLVAFGFGKREVKGSVGVAVNDVYPQGFVTWSRDFTINKPANSLSITLLANSQPGGALGVEYTTLLGNL